MSFGGNLNKVGLFETRGLYRLRSGKRVKFSYHHKEWGKRLSQILLLNKTWIVYIGVEWIRGWRGGGNLTAKGFDTHRIHAHIRV